MRRTVRKVLMTGALASGVVLVLAVPATHAQAPVRPDSGSHYIPASIRAPATPSSDRSNSRSQAAATATARSVFNYSAPAIVSPAREYFFSDSFPEASAPSLRRPATSRRSRPPGSHQGRRGIRLQVVIAN